MSERREVRTYKQTVSFEHRASRSSELLTSYQDSVLIMMVPGNGLDKVGVFKFGFPKTATASSLIYKTRQHLKLNQTEGIFLYLSDGTLLQRDNSLGDLYEHKKDEDGFLYVVVAKQEELGN
mmetsp:Transcript_12242/g.23233  ORF Transcript_12242/g.23233 Transcript_12242/m.23233 type:complete len:122 (+) Transcript_12242:35-400(+)